MNASPAVRQEARARFCEQLRAWRRESGFSAMEVDRRAAQRMPVCPRWTSQLEHGRLAAPDRMACGVLARVLGVHEEALWGLAARARNPDFDLLAPSDLREVFVELQCLRVEAAELRNALARVRNALAPLGGG